jgi:small GTP-binding protein
MGQAHKVMLLGEIGVGKSSLARRLVFDKFSRDYKPTIGVEVYRYEVPETRVGEKVSLILWDTDGNFGDAIFRHVYLKQAAGALIVADQSRPQTVDAMLRLARGFLDVLPGRSVHFILNKSDLVDEDNRENVTARLAATHIPVVATSALLGTNVEDVFVTTAQAILRRGH